MKLENLIHAYELDLNEIVEEHDVNLVDLWPSNSPSTDVRNCSHFFIDTSDLPYELNEYEDKLVYFINEAVSGFLDKYLGIHYCGGNTFVSARNAPELDENYVESISNVISEFVNRSNELF